MRDIEYGDALAGPMFVDEVRPWVCSAGGDLVVVERDGAGHYVRGTVVKLK